MKDYSEVYLQLMHRLKDVHQKFLNKSYVDAYLVSCDITELAQELEDLAQKLANTVKQ